MCFFNSSPDPIRNQNRWLNHFTSPANRHVLPLLTSLINVVCTYDPVGYGVPYVSAHLLASLSHTHILLFLFFFHHPSLSFLSPFSLLSFLPSPLLPVQILLRNGHWSQGAACWDVLSRVSRASWLFSCYTVRPRPLTPPTRGRQVTSCAGSRGDWFKQPVCSLHVSPAPGWREWNGCGLYTAVQFVVGNFFLKLKINDIWWLIILTLKIS